MIYWTVVFDVVSYISEIGRSMGICNEINILNNHLELEIHENWVGEMRDWRDQKQLYIYARGCNRESEFRRVWY